MNFRTAVRLALLVGLGLLTLILARSDDGIDHGYFDGRLWRISAESSSKMRMVVGEGPQLFVNGMSLNVDPEASPFPNLVRWDGVRWQTLGLVGSFPHLLAVGRQLIVAGKFTGVARVAATNIARWDNGTWYPLGPGIQGTVHSLATGNGRVYVGGQLSGAGSLSLTNVASWDLASGQWSALGDGLPAPVRVLEATPDGLFAVWPGEGADVLSRWNGQKWETIASIHGSRPDEVVPVSDLLWHDDSLFMAGSFDQIDGQESGLVARWKAGKWEKIGDNINGQPRSLAVASRDLFVAGSLLIQSGGVVVGAGPVARLRDQQWELSDLGPGAVEAEGLVGWGRELFAIGMLQEEAPIGSSQYPVIWQFNGETWSPLNGGLGEFVSARKLARHGDGVVVKLEDSRPPLLYDGTRFSLTSNSPAFNFVGTRTLGSDGNTAYALAAVNDASSNYVVVRLEGHEWKPAAGPLPVPAAVLTFGDNRLFAAGRASSSGVAGSVVWAWNGNTWAQLGGEFQKPGLLGAEDGVITSLAWMDGSLYAGGSFTHLNGESLPSLARWNGLSWEKVGDFNGPINGLAAARGILHVVGEFSGLGAVTNSSYAQWNGREWSTLGTGLLGMIPQAVAVSDSGLVMACGQPQQPSLATRSLLLWRGIGWISPLKDQHFPRTLWDAVWIGNDLYLAPEFLELECWHEREAQILIRQTGDGRPRLRVTGGTPPHFSVERAPDLQNWTPFATNALGNPGEYFRDPSPLSPQTFYRIRELDQSTSATGGSGPEWY